MPLLEIRLGIVEIDLAGRAGHEQEDDVPGFRSEVRIFRGERVDRGCFDCRAAFLGQQVSDCDGLESAADVAKEIAAGLDTGKVVEGHGSVTPA